ncbi:MAG TPA: DUF433 domain-containing protein [Thermoanaerobaculia bacterium]
MGGTPCFRGTRVPVKTLFDYLAHGHPLAGFLDDFPTVYEEQALAALEEARDLLDEESRWLSFLVNASYLKDAGL